MLVIYTSPGCASCRKAKQWLKDHAMPFVEKNIFSTILNEKEIRFLLERSENGTDDIISKRSKIIKGENIDLDSMSVNELVRFIQGNPSILKRPILLDERRLLVGYDDEEMEAFVPAQLRYIADSCCNQCPEYDSCGKMREA
ncbi:MAG: transcriptional regulator Spx [Erysipelotrichaceae bacterium]|nr:transcriptional regulator Spx [Erysipelotrichaceae bacterium]